MFSLNFMFFCSLIKELCTKEENYKTTCTFNFGRECNLQQPMNVECTFEFNAAEINGIRVTKFKFQI